MLSDATRRVAAASTDTRVTGDFGTWIAPYLLWQTLPQTITKRREQGDADMPIATPEIYADMLHRAKEGRFAYPAINVTSSQTLNAGRPNSTGEGKKWLRFNNGHIKRRNSGRL